MELGPYGRNAGWMLLAVMAIVYGVGGAFLGGRVSAATESAWWLWGSLIMGLGFLAFMVVPFVLSLRGGTRHRADDKHRV